MVAQSKVDEYIKEWEGASRPELRDRLKTLKKKLLTSDRRAEIKAIEALLS